MINIIIGKDSNLTNSLTKHIFNAIILSGRDPKLIEKIKLLNKYKKINLIFNNFYPAARINNLNHINYTDFYKQSLLVNSEILKNINKKIIKKIIYTSSSSIYGSINENFDDNLNRKIYTSTKIANENLFTSFCKENSIQYIIARVFNIYGSNKDNFSIVSKLISANKLKKKFIVNNNGISIRDFIHVKDVAKIYDFLLKNNDCNGVFDIGTGTGIKIIDILHFIGRKKIKYKLIDNFTNEIQTSIANTDKLNNFLKNYKFISLESYLRKELKIRNVNNIKKYLNINKNNIQLASDEKIIYGAGNAGQQALKELVNSNIKVTYFVDDNSYLYGRDVLGVKVISFEELQSLSKKIYIKSVLVAIPSLSELRRKKIINKLEKICSNIEFLPSKKNLISDKINLSDINSSDINYILNRKQKVFTKNDFSQLKNKNILITGAGGSIGSELCKQLSIINAKKIIALDHSEISIYNLKKFFLNYKKIHFVLGDILDLRMLENTIQKNKIDIVIHAAAYKHVSILEKDLLAAVKNNILGTLRVLEASIKLNSRFVLVSTDKAVKPVNNLGITKRIAEIICQSYRQFNKTYKIDIVRFGNVFGSVGSVVPLFLEQINNNSLITITNRKVTRYLMTIKEACLLLLSTLKFRKKVNDGVFVLDMGKPILIFDIIKKLIELKKRFNPNLDYRVQEIGLQKGEKMHEELIINKNNKKIINKNIFICSEPKYTFESIQDLILKINFKLNNYNTLGLLKDFKSFLKKEI
jgi:FlaA1/EpsC-like NDP-sugar epimerase